MSDVKHCKYCGKSIQLDEVFGWYHGDIEGGWNTSCEDDQNRAWPTDVDEPEEKDHIWRCKDVYGAYVQLLLVDDEITGNSSVMDFIEERVQEEIKADHKHVFVNLVISSFKTKVYHDCPGKEALSR